MQPNRGGGSKKSDDEECCEFQHGDHGMAPDLRLGESHGQDQFQFVDNNGLIEWDGLGICGDNYTSCRAGRATQGGLGQLAVMDLPISGLVLGH